MDDGRTYEALEVARTVMDNEAWVKNLTAISDSRDRFRKIWGIVPAACRVAKLKLSEAEMSYACYKVSLWIDARMAAE